MLASGWRILFTCRVIPGLVAGSVLLGQPLSILADQDRKATAVPRSLSAIDSPKGADIDQLKRQARKIGELLDHASKRVDRLARDSDGRPDGTALYRAVRQELDLSRQWNRHLSSILLEVAETRRELHIRERRAAAEIKAFSLVAEEARLELVALKKALEQDGKRAVDTLEDGSAADGLTPQDTKALPAPDLQGMNGDANDPQERIDQARRVLESMDEAQALAAHDLDMVRSKLLEALKTLDLPHRNHRPAKPSDSSLEDSSLSSQEIMAWAASIAGKLHREGFETIEQAKAEIEQVAHGNGHLVIDVMLINSEAAVEATVHAAPDHDAPAVAVIAEGHSVLVTGKVQNANWYRIEIAGGRQGFVPGEFIRGQAAPDRHPTRRIKAS